MPNVSANKFVRFLIKDKLTLAIAESCTGGYLSHQITNIPGSSQVFLAGIIAYSNNAKNRILKVPESVIKKNGAVSAEVASLMSKNILKLANSDLGVGITGIAGPGGATSGKPVGTVFISVASKNKIETKKFKFSGSRIEIKNKSAQKAIELLLEVIGARHLNAF